jgi:hypothetical protein
MEKPVEERSSLEENRIVDYESEKSSNFNNIVSEIVEKDQESQKSGKGLSTFRLVLILAALWVCPKLPPSSHRKTVADKISSLVSYSQR